MNSWKECWEKGYRLKISGNHGLVQCESDWCWDPVKFVDFDLWIVLDGTGEMRINDEVHFLSTGFGICFPPGLRHVHAEHDPDSPLQVFYCHFQIVTPKDTLCLDSFSNKPFHFITDALLWGGIHEFTRLDRMPHTEALRELLLWQMLLRFEIRHSDAISPPLERVEAIARNIRKSPGERHDVDSMAKQAGVSSGHFRRLFREITGESPVDFVLKNRLQRACYYLSETRQPIQQIAHNLGYPDVYYFSRQFKDRMGMSPSRWRNRESAPGSSNRPKS